MHILHSPANTRSLAFGGLCRAIALAGCLAASARAEAAAAAAAPSVLNLTNGGTVAGTLVDSPDSKLLRWQGASFTTPFAFDIKKVTGVFGAMPSAPPRPLGEYLFELAGGDILFGGLAGLSDDTVIVDDTRLGRLHIERTALRRIERWRDGGDLLYLGPHGLTGWREVAPGKGGREEGSTCVLDQPGTAIQGDFAVGARTAFEIELSWKSSPDFVLALGVDASETVTRRAFRFEVWEGALVVQRETEREADVALVSKVPTGPGRVDVRAYLDQEAGKIVVVSADGKTLADMKVAEDRPRVFPGLRLENKRGDVRLERLRISRWDGSPRATPRGEGPQLQRVDGSTVRGEVARLDAEARTFVLRGKDDETRVAEDQVASLGFTASGDDPPRSARVVLDDGRRLSGELIKVEGGALWLKVPGVEETPRFPIARLRSLALPRNELKPGEDPKPAIRLELSDARLTGRLVDASEQPGSSCLAWQPTDSDTASPIRTGASGKIVLKEQASPAPVSASTRATTNQNVVINRKVVIAQRMPAGGGAVGNRLVVNGELNGVIEAAPAEQLARGIRAITPQAASRRRALHLRSGDIIPIDEARIDENGVMFRTPLTENTFVAHEKVKAVELLPELPATVRLTKLKRDRLLTVPRMQKGSPPTHLVRSVNGDYLRGRIVAMDDAMLQMEVRLETRDIPRDRIARIIWFHADELDAPEVAPPAPGPGNGTRVHAVRGDGTRLTFAAERFEDGTLSGKSDVLGECRVSLGEVDRILIGGAIEQEASRLAFHQWTLHSAPEPTIPQDGENASPDGRAAGTASALVGKPAPDFELDLLEGKKFRLSENKGKVVVLDFWATWCGPCMQAMPQVDRVTQEFADDDVRLVTVNLQEAPKEITAMLERHKLNLTVALDRDGAIAERYGATAIPQTVIVDREGTIARLFIGGGPRFGDQLREALQAVSTTRTPKP